MLTKNGNKHGETKPGENFISNALWLDTVVFFSITRVRDRNFWHSWKKTLSHSWNNFRIQLLILNSGWKQGVAKAFSLYQNVPDVLSFDHDQDSIQCVHGIRFLSLAWLVLGNSFLFAALSLTKAPVTGKSQRSVWCWKVEKHTYIHALLKTKKKKNNTVEWLFLLKKLSGNVCIIVKQTSLRWFTIPIYDKCKMSRIYDICIHIHTSISIHSACNLFYIISSFHVLLALFSQVIYWKVWKWWRVLRFKLYSHLPLP